jgi:hypothetical protein
MIHCYAPHPPPLTHRHTSARLATMQPDRPLKSPSPAPRRSSGTQWDQSQRAARGEIVVQRRVRPEDVPLWESVRRPGESGGATIWRLVLAEIARIGGKSRGSKKSTGRE